MNFLTDVFLASGDPNWNTPPHLKRAIYDEFKITFDPCPEQPTFDGLQVEWGERNFVNPPFTETAQWIRKLLKEREKGKDTVLLMPARTCTGYFHELVLPNVDTIRFLRGRVRYKYQKTKQGKPPGASPWPTLLCIFKGKKRAKKVASISS